MRKVLIIFFMLTICVEATAWESIGDINKNTLKDVGRAVDKAHGEMGDSDKDVSKAVELSIGAEKFHKANTICQNECSVCFDGVECDFSCVEKVCLQ